MPRQSKRLQLKRAQPTSTASGAKRTRAAISTRASSATSTPTSIATSGSTSDRPTSGTLIPPVSSGTANFNMLDEDHLSRLADAVAQRIGQANSTSHNQIVVSEVPASTVTVPTIAPESLEPAALAATLGLVQQPRSGEPQNPFVSSCIPVDARVTDKIRQKIWANEFVDLGILLVRPVNQNRFQLSVGQVAESSQSTTLLLEPAEKPKRIANIDQWLSAFQVYVGVYTAKYPQDSPALMKYISIIRDLAERGMNWRFYDENFRFMRQTHVSSFPWGSIHSELWLRSQSTPQIAPQRNPGRFSPANSRIDSIPFGHCFKFHRGLYCAGCRFKHVCYKCNGKHPIGKCSFRDSQNRQSNLSPKSTSSNTTNSSKSR